jgi:peptidoglycan/LPS O-acetylase OafA/YrhL
MKSYRPDIDGLRAVAVLAVLVFHFRFGLPGGYVGVDIFFVVSGFLITRLILDDLEQGSFRLGQFWERRVRRILPGALSNLMVTLAVGWFIYLPSDYRQLGMASLAQCFFGANFYHWRIAGYFQPEAEALPLLHNWSLALEEQFYLLFPLFMMLLHGRRRLLSWALLGAAILSFVACIVLTPVKASLSFYLLPTRAWELALGALLVLLPRRVWLLARIPRELMAWMGAGAILASFTLYDLSTPFPGLAAALPCLGTAALIWANAGDLTLPGRILATRPFVFIGKISYSLYLLHWPALVFLTYGTPTELPFSWKLGLFIGSIGGAAISWHFVEQTVRNRTILKSRRKLFVVMGATAAVVAIASGAIVGLEGVPKRFNPELLSLTTITPNPWMGDGTTSRLRSDGFTNTQAGSPHCLVWGDSHGMALMPALDALAAKANVQILGAFRGGTPPILHPEAWMVEYKGGREDNQRRRVSERGAQLSVDVLHKVRDLRPPHVLLVARWEYYRSNPDFETRLEETVQELTGLGCRVWIFEQVPRQSFHVPRALGSLYLRNVPVETLGISLAQHRERNLTTRAVFERLTSLRVTVLDPAPVLSNGTDLCRVASGKVALYRDDDHLSVEGALLMQPLLAPIFNDVGVQPN